MRTNARILLLIVFCACWIAGCTANDPTSGTQLFPIAFVDFPAAQALHITTPQTHVIRDVGTWDAFWQAHGPVGAPLPTVDFTQDMLIGVFWGASGTGCFNFVDSILSVQVRITGVNTIGVLEVDVGPLPNLGNCATPVNPLQVILLETTITPVQFTGVVPS